MLSEKVGLVDRFETATNEIHDEGPSYLAHGGLVAEKPCLVGEIHPKLRKRVIA